MEKKTTGALLQEAHEAIRERERALALVTCERDEARRELERLREGMRRLLAGEKPE